jgi:4-hydroxy-tetrahydrodipicolinate synthase
VSGLLSVAPYYSKPTQDGLFQHYETIAEAVSLPIVLYNVPGRTSVNIEPATVRRLANVENIVGVKEASGNISQIGAICSQARENFTVLSGDDAVTLPAIALGARGVISVASNEIPAEMTQLAALCLAGNFVEARALHRRLLPLMEVNFAESNPIPVKAAMAQMGLIEPVWRLPLCPPRPETMEKIRGVLESMGLVGNRHAARVN